MLNLTDNPIELLIKLGVNEGSSKANINTQISELSSKLDELKISVNIDNKAVDSLEKLSKVNLDKLSQTIKKMEGDFEGLGDKGKGAGDDLAKGIGQAGQASEETTRTVKKSAEEMSEFMKIASQDIDKTFGHMSKEFRENLARGTTDIEKLKSAFDGLDPKFDMEAINVEDLFGDYQKVVKNVTVEYRNAQGQIEKATLAAKEFVDTGTGETVPMFQPVSESVKVMDDSMKRVGVSTQKVQKELTTLLNTGRITSEQYKELSMQAGKVSNPSQMELLNQKIKTQVNTNKENANVLKEQQKTQENIRKTVNEIIRMQGKNPQAFDNPEVDGMIKSLEKIDPTAKGASASVKEVSDNFERMKAEATVAGRESMTFMDSFKTAMEKFPVWMAASTAFYGTVRSIRDAITQIIELDTQMTVLRRVGGDAVDTNKILEESVELAGKLGNQISDINDGFIAFARQGFGGDELAKMAEYATLLGNISELSVEDASSVLTAGLKGFNIEAEDAIRIVDALNEVDRIMSPMLEIA